MQRYATKIFAICASCVAIVGSCVSCVAIVDSFSSCPPLSLVIWCCGILVNTIVSQENYVVDSDPCVHSRHC